MQQVLFQQTLLNHVNNPANCFFFLQHFQKHIQIESQKSDTKNGVIN